MRKPLSNTRAMGFSDGKHSVFGVGSSKDSGHPKCPPTASASRTHHRQHAHRERRFHVPRQALGVDYDSYDVAGPSLLPPQSATEPVTKAIERELLSDQEVVQQPARSGMRICAWALWIILILINYKLIIVLWVMVWVMAASGWPNLR